jgi:DNA-binding response OmpR family regulator
MVQTLQVGELQVTHIPKILVVCNSPDTAVLWGFILREKGLNVILERSPEQAIDRWSEEMPDVVAIDMECKDQECVTLCKSFRSISMVPILFLLPAHHETIILEAYRAGVDEVVVKPISPMIFQAKVLAWARRSWTVPMAGLNTLKAGGHHLDPVKRCLVDPAGTEIKLTNLEFNLLHLLMGRSGQVCTTEELIHSIWGTFENGDHILVRNVVYRLRKKIEIDPAHPIYLLTWPKGYSFLG